MIHGLDVYKRQVVDRRIVQVKLKENNDIYLLEVHRKSLAIVDEMIAYWGPENTQKIVDSLQLITQAARYVISNIYK